MTSTNRLHKSSKDKVLFGVAGGLAEHFAVDPTLVRLVFVLLTFASGAGIIIYLVLAVIMPPEQTSATQPADVIRENLQSIPSETAEAGRRIGDAFSRGDRPVAPAPAQEDDQQAQETGRRRNTLGIILIAIGALAILINFGAFWWFSWGVFWPLALILIGVIILVSRFGGRK
jgi:phage shock protein C